MLNLIEKLRTRWKKQIDLKKKVQERFIIGQRKIRVEVGYNLI